MAPERDGGPGRPDPGFGSLPSLHIAVSQPAWQRKTPCHSFHDSSRYTSRRPSRTIWHGVPCRVHEPLELHPQQAALLRPVRLLVTGMLRGRQGELDVRLSEDGSAEPPGDRLVADVLLYPGTDRVDLVVEAEAVSVAPVAPAAPTPPPGGEGPSPVAGPADSALQVRPVGAKDAAFRGADGRFRIRTTVKGQGRAGVMTSTIIVPHAALALLRRGTSRSGTRCVARSGVPRSSSRRPAWSPRRAPTAHHR